MYGFQVIRVDNDHFACVHCAAHLHIKKKYFKTASVCRECFLFNRKCNYLTNRKREIKRQKKYNKKHKKQISKYLKKWIQENKDKHNAYVRTYQKGDKFKEIIKKYYLKNKKKINERRLKRRKERLKTDINFKLKHNLRSSLRCALKTNAKKGSAVRDLGCSVEFLKQYLEAKFQSGMTWENWGRHGWHLDHIKPLSKFNLQDREEFLRACHYTNLQPLWYLDNIKKSNK